MQLVPLFALGEARRRLDLAVRYVLAVGFGSYAGAVHERARTNLSPAGQHLYGDTGDAAVVFAVEFAEAEARRCEEGSAIDWIPANYVRNVSFSHEGHGDLPGSHTVYDDPTGIDWG